MKISKFIHIIPYLIICIILVYTWYTIITSDYYATTKHQIALGIAIINLFIYLLRFKFGVIVSGLLLFFAAFNFIALFPNIVTSSYFIRILGKEIATPSINWKSLVLMILYFVLNTRYLIDLYFDSKYPKSSDN
jgi:hypothetical protein